MQPQVDIYLASIPTLHFQQPLQECQDKELCKLSKSKNTTSLEDHNKSKS